MWVLKILDLFFDSLVNLVERVCFFLLVFEKYLRNILIGCCDFYLFVQLGGWNDLIGQYWDIG